MRKQLHPGAKWLFRLGGLFGGFMLIILFGWVFAIPLTIMSSSNALNIAGKIMGLIFVYIIVIILIAEVYARMAYSRWFYDFTEDNLRLERGIIWKRYSNVPYERVQNVDIRRGIIARLFGFSEVYIQTAGFASVQGRGTSAEGYIPAVDINEAEKIRSFLMKKISKKGRRQGL